jgi:glutamate racemase
VIRIYLDELLAEAAAASLNPDTLVLGCTHYPLLRPLIEAAVPAGMKVIDSAEATAEAAVNRFNGRAAGPTENAGCPILDVPFAATVGEQPADPAGLPTPSAQVRCFATDSTDKFERLGSGFLGRPTGKVELVDLGG